MACGAGVTGSGPLDHLGHRVTRTWRFLPGPSFPLGPLSPPGNPFFLPGNPSFSPGSFSPRPCSTHGWVPHTLSWELLLHSSSGLPGEEERCPEALGWPRAGGGLALGRVGRPVHWPGMRDMPVAFPQVSSCEPDSAGFLCPVTSECCVEALAQREPGERPCCGCSRGGYRGQGRVGRGMRVVGPNPAGRLYPVWSSCAQHAFPDPDPHHGGSLAGSLQGKAYHCGHPISVNTLSHDPHQKGSSSSVNGSDSRPPLRLGPFVGRTLCCCVL